MNEIDAVIRKLDHEIRIIQRKMDVSLVVIGMTVGFMNGFLWGLVL